MMGYNRRISRMNDNLVKFSNRTLMVMLVMLVISWALTLTISSFVWHASLESLIATSLAEVVFISVIMGFTIYKQRFRDERTIHILEKSGRNGFFFMIYFLPLVIIFYSLIEASHDVAMALVIFWFCSIAVAAISAVYYYRK
jgi:hypothetical protein